jgi:hypothetical protein
MLSFLFRSFKITCFLPLSSTLLQPLSPHPPKTLLKNPLIYLLLVSKIDGKFLLIREQR